jgi:Lysozyme like domain
MAVSVQKMLDYAKETVGAPYVWGGGHSGKWLSPAAAKQAGIDCSAFVSNVLHAGGVNLSGPLDTEGLAAALKKGKGVVTVWDRATGPQTEQHTIIDIAGAWFESGGNKADNTTGGVTRLTTEQAQSELSGGGFVAYTPQGVGSQSTLAQLWIKNGGPPNVANTMAAIAMAESGGIVGKTNQDSNGTVDRGIWQINSVHSQFNGTRLLTDPNYNARAAVAVYKSSGFGAWSTYKSGAYKQFLTGAKSDQVKYGGSRPGGAGAASATTYASNGAKTPSQIYAEMQDGKIAPAGGLDLFAPVKWWWGQESGQWKDFAHDLTHNPIASIVDDVGGGLSAIDTAAGETVKIMEELPWYGLRFIELIFGAIFMGLGVYWARSSGNSGSISRTVGRAVGATPIGRAGRIMGATRAGKREGVEEHYRLTARRQARADEAAKSGPSRSESSRIQARGKSRRERRVSTH